MSTEEKQDYLRTQVLEQGYDAEKFLSFLVSIKGESGADIENWEMNELQQVFLIL